MLLDFKYLTSNEKNKFQLRFLNVINACMQLEGAIYQAVLVYIYLQFQIVKFSEIRLSYVAFVLIIHLFYIDS